MIINRLPRGAEEPAPVGPTPLTIFSLDDWTLTDAAAAQAGAQLEYIILPANTSSFWNGTYIYDQANQLDVRPKNGYIDYKGVRYNITKGQGLRLDEVITLSDNVQIGSDTQEWLVSIGKTVTPNTQR